MAGLTIVASNDLSENVLYSLREQGHEIDTFRSRALTSSTCKAQPALGCVYKLVSINERPRIKVSHDAAKITIPGRKDCYRLYGQSGEPIADLLLLSSNSPPLPGKAHTVSSSIRCQQARVRPLPLASYCCISSCGTARWGWSVRSAR